MDDQDREGEGDLAFAASYCTKVLVNDCLEIARGMICVAVTRKDAERIGITRLPSNNKDLFDTPFGTPVDLDDGVSGISVGARCATIRAISDPAYDSNCFVSPGHVNTLIGHKHGLSGRQGHTEAILDLLSIARIASPGVLCEILNGDGDIATEDELNLLSTDRGLPILHIESITEYMNYKNRRNIGG